MGTSSSQERVIKGFFFKSISWVIPVVKRVGLYRTFDVSVVCWKKKKRPIGPSTFEPLRNCWKVDGVTYGENMCFFLPSISMWIIYKLLY